MALLWSLCVRWERNVAVDKRASVLGHLADRPLEDLGDVVEDIIPRGRAERDRRDALREGYRDLNVLHGLFAMSLLGSDRHVYHAPMLVVRDLRPHEYGQLHRPLDPIRHQLEVAIRRHKGHHPLPLPSPEPYARMKAAVLELLRPGETKCEVRHPREPAVALNGT